MDEDKPQEEQQAPEAGQQQEEKAHETDWKAEARKWEERAKANRAKADEMAAQAAADAVARAEKAEAELAEANARVAHAEAVAKVSRETGVPAHLLHGADEAELAACAQAIGEYVKSKGAAYPADKGGSTGAGPVSVASLESIEAPLERVRARAGNRNLYK